ncbi:NAD(P)H-binding protein [Amycolatopsis sp. NBC_01286]|uniref:NAD(P)H-binding protein n=1 Tax=Amycolatopsis sp. NBC_01286 TaxID=2903560 RepID=UPI002E116473|nr:NAD(P)H-binding protein [Amycolatopsis sp. NBC_01286]
MTNTLILGGTGKTGSRVARHLKDGGHPAKVASRTGGFDLGDATTWASALDGVTAAYVVEPDLRASGDRIPRFVAQAVSAGVRRLVLLSAGGVGEAGEGHPLKAAEQAVRESGAEWTILRPDWFAQNFGEGPWLPEILAGTLSLPTGDGRTPFVDAGDIAEVAASALTGSRHDGRTYQLTGPRALGFGEAVDLIGQATGRVVRHVDVAPEVHIGQLVANGVPPGVAQLLTGILVAIRDGSAPAPTGDVERALGRLARSFEDYVAETAAAGVWA